jgi:hypothetical protein
MTLPFLFLSFGNHQPQDSLITIGLVLYAKIKEAQISKFRSVFSTGFRGKQASNFYSLPSLRIEMNICKEFLYFCQNVTPNRGCSKLTSHQELIFSIELQIVM